MDVVFLHGLLGGLFYTWRQIDHDNSRGWDSNSDLVSTQDYSYCWPRDWFRYFRKPVIIPVFLAFDSLNPPKLVQFAERTKWMSGVFACLAWISTPT